jgi:hypothetical protein
MNSMTMHILGGFVDAAMNSTTFGWRNVVMTWISSAKNFCISLVTCVVEATILTATSVPRHLALNTSP